MNERLLLLAKKLNERKNHLTIVNVYSIVNNKHLSSFKTYQPISNALYTQFEGTYEMSNGLEGNSVYEMLGNNGIVLNLGKATQFIIHEDSKVEIEEYDGIIKLEFKDVRSSMKVRMDITDKKLTKNQIEGVF